MSRYISAFGICLIPFCIFLAHDIYLYINDGEKGFEFSSFGYCFTQYLPEMYTSYKENLNEETSEFFTFFLKQRLVVVGLLFALIMPLLVAAEYYILRVLFGWIGPRDYKKQNEGMLSFRARDREQKYKYKRG